MVVITNKVEKIFHIFSVISSTEESQVTSSDAELDEDDNHLRGEKRFFQRKKKQVVARSDREKCVDIINYS